MTLSWFKLHVYLCSTERFKKKKLHVKSGNTVARRRATLINLAVIDMHALNRIYNFVRNDQNTIKKILLQKNLGTITQWNIFIINTIFKHIRDVFILEGNIDVTGSILRSIFVKKQIVFMIFTGDVEWVLSLVTRAFIFCLYAIRHPPPGWS